MRSLEWGNNAEISRKEKKPLFFLDMANQDILPVLYNHTSKFTNDNQVKNAISKPFNVYSSNDVQQSKGFSQVDDDNSNIGSKSTPYLVIDTLSSGNANWMFCNRVSSVPLFLTDMKVEHKSLLFNVAITLPLQVFDDENTRSISASLKPCLIIRYEGKKKSKSFQKTVKLNPYFKGKRCSLHTSDDDDVGNDKIEAMMKDIKTDPNDVQYLFNTEHLKAQSGTKLINISAILIEIPVGQNMINISRFFIYGE